MAWKRRTSPAFAALILGIACIIGSMSLIAAGQVGETLMEEDFEAYRSWPEDPRTGDPKIPEIPDCTGYPDEDAAIAEGWRFDIDFTYVGLCDTYTEPSSWRLIDECELYGMLLSDPTLFPFASTIQAAYVGFVDPNTGTCNYDGDDAYIISSKLKSPAKAVDPEYNYVDVSFSYWRQVESYGSIPEELDDFGVPDWEDRNYDQTWVSVVFSEDREIDPCETLWSEVTIWYKDSGWPSLESWIQAGPISVEKPAWANYAWLEFHFEVVDNFNNDYVGWFVDNVRLDSVVYPTEICWEEDTPTTLKQGVVGDSYFVDFKGYLKEYYGQEIRFFLAREGVSGCDCGFGDCQKLSPREPSPLPDRLTLSANGVLSGEVTEEMVGAYTFWVLVEGTGVRGENCACHEFYLNIRTDGASTDAIFQSEFGATTTEWYRCNEGECEPANLWKETGSVSGVEIPNPDGAMESRFAAYFGNLYADGAHYDTGERVTGCYCIDLTPYLCCNETIGTEVELGFKQWREVEDYPEGSYDRTWVELSTDGEHWVPVESMDWDSSDPSPQAWEWIQLRTGVTITEDKRLLLRFCFDSIDGFDNQHVGWVVDEVTVWLNPPSFELDNCPLPSGYVSEPYNVALQYAGGIPVSSGARVDGLPSGLACDGKRISGLPREEGTFRLTLTVPGAPAESCDLVIHAQRCFFIEDFEGEWSWVPSGRMWQQVSAEDFPDAQPPCGIHDIGVGLGNLVAYFGQVPQANYYTGQREEAFLTYPEALAVEPGDYISLSFDSCRQVEPKPSGGFDQTRVEVCFGDARSTEPDETAWELVWYKDSADPSSIGWTREEANNGVPFEVPMGKDKMWVRLAFDTYDKWYNRYFGWMVDNLWICYAEEGGRLQPMSGDAASAGNRDGEQPGIAVMNFPNPVTDVHTTTFTVRGEGVEAIRIQIFDQNETLVFEQQVTGQELEWHTDNKYGEYLANGTYYYRAYAFVDGDWIATQFEKVVILR